jgi:hypothetical protein
MRAVALRMLSSADHGGLGQPGHAARRRVPPRGATDGLAPSRRPLARRSCHIGGVSSVNTMTDRDGTVSDGHT